MGRTNHQKRFLSLVWVFLFPLAGPGAADIRTVPLDVNLIIDGSREMRPFMDEAAAWLCGYLVERLLAPGDRLSVWIAGEKAQRLYSDVLGGRDWKETAKESFRSLAPEAGKADFAGALGEAARLPRGKGDIPAYTILVSSGTSLLGEEEAAYLRYSRNREFAGWRVVTVALDAGPGIREAVRAYLAGGRN
ncbi:MAG: VWA domain-containing protein [Treponema sp.]|jgi:hypothetical protein|nr:VWA domain-containing protein [Treponema sp.]